MEAEGSAKWEGGTGGLTGPPAPDRNEGEKWQEKKNCEEEPVKSLQQISSLPPFQNAKDYGTSYFPYTKLLLQR